MIEAGSFRDPESRVFYRDGRVLRGLSAGAADIDRAARDSGLMSDLIANGWFVANWVVEDVAPPEGAPATAVIESERIPLISYPAEWSFAMLRDAALTTLDANLAALDRGFILKDASAFNVAFRGTTPTIIDVGSIDRFGKQGIWTAYGQFCEHFLAPLMLEAFTGVPFQRLLTGSIDGIPIGDLNRLLRGRSGVHKGVLTHVRLRNLLEKRAAGMNTEARREVGATTLPSDSIAATIRKMRDLVAGLESSAPSTWADYEAALPYEEESTQAKLEFVRNAADLVDAHNLAVDVGANAGLFTRVLAERFDQVVGIDNDPGAIDALYTSTASSDIRNLTPLVVDITNPTPSFGWRGQERAAFIDRVRPSFSTWLAVLHHLCLGLGLPLDQVVALTYETSEASVVEFVSPADPMAQRISASRTTRLTPYNREDFERYALAGGSIVTRTQISDTRTMYHLRRN